LPLVREATSPFLTLPSEVVARAGHASARQAERLARAEIVGNVTMAFYSMLAVREELNTSREIVDLSRALHESVRRRVEQQLLPPVDLLAVESALISAQAQVGAAEANLAKARELFALALGLDPSSEATRTLDVVDTASSRPVLLPLDDMLKHMTTAHPSVLIQQAKVREAEAALGLLRTERYPTLDAVMAIGAVDDFNPPADGWSLRALLRLNWNIYDFGVLKLKIKQQHEVVGAERHALELVRNRLSQSLVTAYHNLTASRTRLAAAEKAIELAGEEVRVAERRQQQGVAPESDVLRGRVKQATARRAAAQAHYATLIEEAVVAMSTVAE
jgi:outer membrane protein